MQTIVDFSVTTLILVISAIFLKNQTSDCGHILDKNGFKGILIRDILKAFDCINQNMFVVILHMVLSIQEWSKKNLWKRTFKKLEGAWCALRGPYSFKFFEGYKFYLVHF